METQKLGIILDHAINDNDTNKSKNCRPQAVVLLSSEPRAERQKVKLCKFMTQKKKNTKKKKEERFGCREEIPSYLPTRQGQWRQCFRRTSLLYPNPKFRTPKRSIRERTRSSNALFKRKLQRSTNRLYEPRDVVWVTGLIIDSVRFLTDAQAAQLIKPVRICINIRKRLAMCSGLVRWPYFTHTLRSRALTLCAIEWFVTG